MPSLREHLLDELATAYIQAIAAAGGALDAGPSLRAAEGLPATALLTYLRSTGWMAEPSRVEGIAILSKMFPGADEPVVFILPEVRGFGDEQRRVADALRTIEAVEQRPMSTIVADVRKLAARVSKKLRGKVPQAKKAFAGKKQEGLLILSLRFPSR
jgi:hypothetical protein